MVFVFTPPPPPSPKKKEGKVFFPRLSSIFIAHRLRLLAESKGYVLDDTGLYLATKGSGGKRVRMLIHFINNVQSHLEASFHLLLNLTGREIRCNSELSHREGCIRHARIPLVGTP
jgi:hypothetical protein